MTKTQTLEKAFQTIMTGAANHMAQCILACETAAQAGHNQPCTVAWKKDDVPPLFKIGVPGDIWDRAEYFSVTTQGESPFGDPFWQRDLFTGQILCAHE